MNDATMSLIGDELEPIIREMMAATTDNGDEPCSVRRFLMNDGSELFALAIGDRTYNLTIASEGTGTVDEDGFPLGAVITGEERAASRGAK